MELIHECEPMQSKEEEEQGIYEWACVTCGRRLRITSNPFGVTVLVTGDEVVQHAGTTGVTGLRIRGLAQEVRTHGGANEQEDGD